jgi:glutaredoxin
MKIQPHHVILTFIVGLLSTSPATGEIYKWIDEHGNVHFTDRPPPNQITEKVTVKINSYTSPEIIDVDRLFGKTNKIIMYSTSRCGFCKKARDYFHASNIDFEEYDVENSNKGKRDYEKLGGSGVPIILMGNQRMNGFSVKKFERFYQNNKKQ